MDDQSDKAVTDRHTYTQKLTTVNPCTYAEDLLQSTYLSHERTYMYMSTSILLFSEVLRNNPFKKSSCNKQFLGDDLYGLLACRGMVLFETIVHEIHTSVHIINPLHKGNRVTVVCQCVCLLSLLLLEC